MRRTLCVLILLLVMVIPQESFAASGSIRFTNLDKNTVIRVGGHLKAKYKITGKYRKYPVAFRSSNRKIATVSSKGVIRGKKKGQVTITVYVKKKKSLKRKVTIYIGPRENPKIRASLKIRVGTRVQSIALSGLGTLQPGRSTKLKAEVAPEEATERKLTWTTSNPKVATVASTGKVTAHAIGDVTITAAARDGSGVKGTFDMRVFQLRKDETHWIAHRGLSAEAPENTAEAFRKAGEYGFWGSECDIWETRHDDETGNFDIVINHNPSFLELYGIDRKVRDMTAEEIRSEEALAQVCFLQEYLDICKEYGMVPVIEFKDPSMSQEAMDRVLSMVYVLDEGESLEKARYISFYPDLLSRVADSMVQTYGVRPCTYYLISVFNYPKENFADGILLAEKMGCTGIGMNKTYMTEEIGRMCDEKDLLLNLWTYKDTASAEAILEQHIRSENYNVESATVNGKAFATEEEERQ